MTLVKASLIGVVAAVATLAATAAASATTYDFTLRDNNGVTIDASGVLTLTGDVIDSIAGSINGYGAITDLIANPNSPGANLKGDIIYDNLFDPSVPGVDNNGIFVSTASGDNFNLFNVHSWGSNIPDNTATVYDDNAGRYVANGTFSITAVPEPAAWALMLVGIGLAGATVRSESKLALAKARARS
jgi:PEP-CTERM motif